jgi:hypothetical protein
MEVMANAEKASSNPLQFMDNELNRRSSRIGRMVMIGKDSLAGRSGL